MPTRFPQGTGSLVYRIKPEWAGKIEAVWWAVAANSVQRLFYGASATTLITRTASGCAFNAADGRITGSNTVGTATSFSDSTGTAAGIGGLTESSNFVLGVGYFGDNFNGGSAPRALLGSRVQPDTLTIGTQISLNNFDINVAIANSGLNAVTGAGFSDSTQGFMHIAIRHNQADATKKLRVWTNGAENTGSGAAAPTPDKSTAIGSTAFPVYFGDTFTGTGTTALEFEFAFIGTAALTSADLDSITSIVTNPADVLLEVAPPPPPTPPKSFFYRRKRA